VGQESSWNPLARNPSSGAFGLFQFLGSTKDAYLPDENPNPGIQGAAGARYIRDRYGLPTAAKAFWENHNWYDNGGIFSNNSIGINQSGKPEAVLTNDQWNLFAAFNKTLAEVGPKFIEKVGDIVPSAATDIFGMEGTLLDPGHRYWQAARDVAKGFADKRAEMDKAQVEQGAPQKIDNSINIGQVQTMSLEEMRRQLQLMQAQQVASFSRR